MKAHPPAVRQLGDPRTRTKRGRLRTPQPSRQSATRGPGNRSAAGHIAELEAARRRADRATRRRCARRSGEAAPRRGAGNTSAIQDARRMPDLRDAKSSQGAYVPAHRWSGRVWPCADHCRVWRYATDRPVRWVTSVLATMPRGVRYPTVGRTGHAPSSRCPGRCSASGAPTRGRVIGWLAGAGWQTGAGT